MLNKLKKKNMKIIAEDFCSHFPVSEVGVDWCL